MSQAILSDRPRKPESSTDSILVVLDADDPDTTLRAVIKETDVASTTVHLLAVYPTAEYEKRRRDRLEAGVPGPYTLDHLADEARRVARRAGREYLGSDPAAYEAMGAVGDKPDCIRRTAQDADYRRIFVAEHSQSIWQQLLGVESISTEVTRTLPDVVSVVAVNDVLDDRTDNMDADTGLDTGAESTPRSHET